jgi:hypothetical protein
MPAKPKLIYWLKSDTTISAESLVMQPLASVVVTTYFPAVRFTMSFVVSPFDQLYAIGSVAPSTRLTLITPLLDVQIGLMIESKEILIAG